MHQKLIIIGIKKYIFFSCNYVLLDVVTFFLILIIVCVYFIFKRTNPYSSLLLVYTPYVASKAALSQSADFPISSTNFQYFHQIRCLIQNLNFLREHSIFYSQAKCRLLILTSQENKGNVFLNPQSSVLCR